MIKAKPFTLKDRIRDILEICEKARTEIDGQLEIIKGALDAGAEDHGLDPGAMRRLLAYRRQKAKDPAKIAHALELDDQYRFMAEGGASFDQPAAVDSEVDRVMALTTTSKPPKIEAIKKALGCSQGKAHKLRSLAAARLAMRGAPEKSSSSSTLREHEHLAAHDPATGEVIEETADLDTPPGDGEASADERAVSASSSPPINEPDDRLGVFVELRPTHNHNARILERTRWVPMQLGTPESGDDPRNPNAAPQASILSSTPQEGDLAVDPSAPVPDGGVGAGTHSETESCGGNKGEGSTPLCAGTAQASRAPDPVAEATADVAASPVPADIDLTIPPFLRRSPVPA